MNSEINELAQEIAQALLQAGYRKQRVITTGEELDALPKGAVIRDGIGDAVVKEGDAWCCTDGCCTYSTKEQASYLPAIVLWEPSV